jgi:uncharacterized membrane protein YfcA
MLISVVFASLLTGLLMGIFGSGGSIITVPALLFLLDIEPKSAIAMSFGIVAITASVSAINYWMHGNVNIKITLVFGFFGIIGSYAGALLGVITPILLQEELFSMVMYAAAWSMLKSDKQTDKPVNECGDISCEKINNVNLALQGAGIGVITGIIGVGGGFLIVPVLVVLSGLSTKRAIGTSLSIVALNSFSGFEGYAHSIAVDYELMAIFTIIAIIGSFIGHMIFNKLHPEHLKKAFGFFLIFMATYMFIKSILLA